MIGDTIIVDVSNLCHRNWFALSRTKLKNPVIFGLLRDIKSLTDMLGKSDFVFCFDCDSSQYARRAIYPEYKKTSPGLEAKKSERDSRIRGEIEILYNDVLPVLGYNNVFRVDKMEADDLIAFLCRGETCEDPTIVSSDHDLYQLLDVADVWQPTIKQLMTQELLWQQHELTPSEWVRFRALIGDPADNIFGVSGIGILRAQDYILGRMSVGSTLYTRILNSTEKLLFNSSLLTLPFASLQNPNLEVLPDQVNADTWDKVCDEYEAANLVGRCP